MTDWSYRDAVAAARRSIDRLAVRLGAALDDATLVGRYRADPFGFLFTADDRSLRRVAALVAAGRAPTLAEAV